MQTVSVATAAAIGRADRVSSAQSSSAVGRLYRPATTNAIAKQILLGYATIFYFLPALLTLMFGGALDQILLASPNYFLGFLVCSAAVWALWFAIPRVPVPKLSSLQIFGRMLFSTNATLLGAGLFFLLSLYFFYNFGLAYRQTGERIGDSGPYAILYYVFQTYVFASLAIMLGRSAEELRADALRVIPTGILIASAILLSLQASSNVILFAGATLTVVRAFSGKEFFRPTIRGNSFGTLFIAGIAGLGAVFVGLANKIGVDSTYEMFTHDFMNVIEVVQRRISYHYFSASFHTTFNFLNFEMGFKALESVLVNFEHRLDVILGRSTIFNEITSVKRLNYELINFTIRERTGTAPGMVGGLFFYPLGIFIAPLIIVVYAMFLKLVASLMRNIQPGIVELVILVFLFGGLVDGGLDLVNPFDQSFMRLILLLLACAALGARSARPAPQQHTPTRPDPRGWNSHAVR